MGSDLLFENHSIKEIQEIEKKLRNDIEKKKEELRQMVGERYRDLMEAADTITEMKEIAESVSSSVKSIAVGCHGITNGSLQHGILSRIQDKVAEKKKRNELLYTVASQIKILIDAPTMIWSYIEQKNYTAAISVYLLARHIHSTLLLDPLYKEQNILLSFPIINKQWTSISSFRYVLLQTFQQSLKMLDSEPQDVVGPMCVSCFLSNKTLENTLKDILDAKKVLVKSIFRPEKYAKTQICEFVTVIQSTLRLLFYLLFPEEEESSDQSPTNILYKAINNMTNKDLPGPVSLIDLKSSETFKFLPKEITDFHPVTSSPVNSFSAEYLCSCCNDWLVDLKTSFELELKNLLNFVKSVQSLSLIREAVGAVLAKVSDWDHVCNSLLQKPFSIWDFFLKNCFFQRIEEIIDDGMKSASDYCQKDVEETMFKIVLESEAKSLEYERNSLPYVWRESEGDMLEDTAWEPRHHRSLWDSGELSMKSMGFTPKIQNICKDLDTRVEDVLMDASHFFTFENPRTTDVPDNKRTAHLQKIAVDLSCDSRLVYEYISKAAEKHLFNISNFIAITLLYLEKEVESCENSYRAVSLAHISNGISHLCPHINLTLSSTKLVEIVSKSKHKGSKIVFTTVNTKECDLWKDLKKKFLELSSAAFKLWSKYHIGLTVQSIDSNFTVDTPEGLLKSLLQWDKIEIQEESEQGNAVKSILRIPQYVSTPVTNALFHLCCKLNTIGGYVITSDVRSSISRDLLRQLLPLYERRVGTAASHPRLLQLQSLQLMFDVQCLAALLLAGRSEEFGDAVSGIVTRAVSHVDPFDMDVFSVPLQQNVKRTVQKSVSLYGLLANPDQITLLSSARAQSSHSGPMEHNILLAANTGGRFPLLPLPTRSNMATTTDQLLTQPRDVLPIPSRGSSPNLRDPSPTSMGSKSTSFYDRMTAMSSSWFGN